MTPNTMSWREYAQKPDMMLNTPNVASIYMTQLSIDHMLSIAQLLHCIWGLVRWRPPHRFVQAPSKPSRTGHSAVLKVASSIRCSAATPA